MKIIALLSIVRAIDLYETDGVCSESVVEFKA